MDGASPAHVTDDTQDLGFLQSSARSLRLVDAERIASDRLKDAPAGSLKEALATSVVEAAPAAGTKLAERLAEVGDDDDFVALKPFQAVPDVAFGWMDAVPPAHTVPLFEIPDETVSVSASLAQEPAAAAEPVRQPPANAALLPPVGEAETAVPCEQELALSLLAPEHAQAVVATAHEALPEVGVAEPRTMEEAFASMAEDLEERVRTELGLAPGDPKLEPIVTAFAASARLAADATAASQALHHLKRLLVDQLVEEPQFSEGTSAAGAEYGETPAAPAVRGEAGVADAAPLPMATVPEVRPQEASPSSPPPLPRAVMTPSIPAVAAMPRISTGIPLEPPPEELPQIVSKARVLAKEPVRRPQLPVAMQERPVPRVVARNGEAGRRPEEATRELRPSSRNLPVPFAPPVTVERMPLDVRGFCTGFVLSGAIGLLLYFVMSAS